MQASSYTPIDRAQLLKLVRATQGAMEHERRRTRRVTIPSKVRLKFGKEELEGETIDVSMSGPLVRAPRTAPVSSSLGISLQLSDRYEANRSGRFGRPHSEWESDGDPIGPALSLRP